MTSTPISTKRPVSLTILAGLFLFFGIYALGFGGYSILSILRQTPRPPFALPSAFFALLTSALGAGCYLALGVGLLRFRPLARTFTLVIFWLLLLTMLIFAGGWALNSRAISIEIGTYHTTCAESPGQALTLLFIVSGWAIWGLWTLMREPMQKLFGVPISEKRPSRKVG